MRTAQTQSAKAWTLLFTAVAILAPVARAEVIDAVWRGLDGLSPRDWAREDNWWSLTYPNNSDLDQRFYNAFVDADPAVDTTVYHREGWASQMTVDSLTIDFGDTVRIEYGNTLFIERSEDPGREMSGNIFNSGKLAIARTTTNGVVRLGVENDVILSGGGEVVMQDSTSTSHLVRITDRYGAAEGHLINQDNTIRGSGALGYDRLRLTNQALGLIDANVPGRSLRVDPYAGTFSAVNAGTMRASNGGDLWLSGFEGGTFNNTDGIIEALADSTVTLASGVDITGGTLSTMDNGRIELSYNATLRDVTLDGDLFVGSNVPNVLTLAGTITNQRKITSYRPIRMESPNGPVTLTGGGELLLTSTAAELKAASGVADGQLINVDNTIHGLGAIRLGRFTNHALVDANLGTLVVDPWTASFRAFNDGTMRASNGGTLQLEGSGLIDNSGGVIEAQAGSRVYLKDAVRVSGGTLSSSGDGFVDVLNGTLIDLTNQADVQSTGVLRLQGTIDNQARITVPPGKSLRTEDSTAMLTGGGEVVMTGGDMAGNAAGQFVNVDNTVHGYGNVGRSQTQIANHALIDANVNGATLTVDSANGTFTGVNRGTLQASDGGILRFEGGGSFDNTDGTIKADAGSKVELVGNASITGGTLSTSGDGVIQAEQTYLRDVTNDGRLEVPRYWLYLHAGTIENRGLIDVTGEIRYADEVSLTGGGEIVMNAGADMGRQGLGTGHLINVNNTIRGQGDIGNNEARLTNQENGVVIATGGLLRIDPGAATAINAGTFRAEDGGMLVLRGQFSNTGTFEALDGGSIYTSSAAVVQQVNAATQTVMEGTYRSIDQGAGASINVAPIGFRTAVNNGHIEARGVNADNDLLGGWVGSGHTNDSLAHNNGNIILADGANLVVTNSALDAVVSTGELLVGQGSRLDVNERVTTFPVFNDTTEAGLHVDGGILRGSGTIAGGVYMPVGLLEPGDAPRQTGLLTIEGDFNMDDPNLIIEEARTTVELGGYTRGDQYDSFDATGDFFAQGVLTARLIDGFLPNTGAEFVLATYVEDGNHLGTWDSQLFEFQLVKFALDDRSLGGADRETILTVVDVRDIDFDGDGNFNCGDVDALVADIAAGTNTPGLDLNFDDLVDVADLEIWLAEAGAAHLSSGQPYLPGDANLDGVVDASDFNIWNANKFSHTAAWCSGDFNANGVIDASDFNVWNAHKFSSSGLPTFLVPEPSSVWLLLLGGLLTTRFRKR